MRTNHSVIVRGKCHEWSISTMVSPEVAQDWRDDGLEVHEIINTIPLWVADIGLVHVWCLAQDIWNFRWRRRP